MKNTSTIKVTAFTKINTLVLEGLKKDGLKWFMPWKNEDGSLYGPINHATGRAYNGINKQLLSAVARDKGYKSNEWGTFKNISECGGAIRKGEKASAVTLWVLSYEIKETGKYITQAQARKSFNLPADVINGKLRESWSLRYYLVFNIEQADNVTPRNTVEPTEVQTIELIPTAEAIYNNYPNSPTLEHGGSSAHYVPSQDHVQMPNANQFFDIDSYYKTLFHELIHSTGHTSRLKRKSLVDIKRSGDELYSKEELVAEIGAWYLTGLCNLDPKDNMINSQAYINGWVKKLQEQEKEVIYAMSQALKGVELIIGKGGDKTPSKPKKATEKLVLASKQVQYNKPSQKVLDRQQKYIDSAKQKSQAQNLKEIEKRGAAFLEDLEYLEKKFGSKQVFINKTTAASDEFLRKYLEKKYPGRMVCEMTFSSKQAAEYWDVYEVLNFQANQSIKYNIYITDFAGQEAIGYSVQDIEATGITEVYSKQVTIYEIANRTAETSNYFDAESLRFFNQRLEHFDIEPIGKGEYICYAPSTWDGRLMGYSCIIYDSESHKLKSLSLTDDEKSCLDGVQEVIEVLKLERQEKVVYSKQVNIDEQNQIIADLKETNEQLDSALVKAYDDIESLGTQIDDWSKEMVQNSISESLGNTLKWFELSTDRKIDRDSEDWAILEKKILKYLIRNSK